MFGLVDGNSFYCSCERAFDPTLRGKPLVVLSNNDGCIIARTQEAKELGLKMGEPWHIASRRSGLASVIWMSSNCFRHVSASCQTAWVKAPPESCNRR